MRYHAVRLTSGWTAGLTDAVVVWHPTVRRTDGQVSGGSVLTVQAARLTDAEQKQ